MKKSIYLLTLSLLGTCALAENEVDRDVWSNHMETNLPSLLCVDESYFRSCFEIDESACLATVAEHTRGCLDRFEADIPERVAIGNESVIWGQAVGSCAGTQSELALLDKRLNTPKCNDPAQW
jgi:hypothetical protein